MAKIELYQRLTQNGNNELQVNLEVSKAVKCKPPFFSMVVSETMQFVGIPIELMKQAQEGYIIYSVNPLSSHTTVTQWGRLDSRKWAEVRKVGSIISHFRCLSKVPNTGKGK